MKHVRAIRRLERLLSSLDEERKLLEARIRGVESAITILRLERGGEDGRPQTNPK